VLIPVFAVGTTVIAAVADPASRTLPLEGKVALPVSDRSTR
jgi:hypothetical protein